MARSKDQTARRRQISEAARRAVVSQGGSGLRIRHIAEEAKLSAGSVLYYYPDIEDLIIEVYEHAVERFSSRRLEAAKEIEQPGPRLAATIRAGLAAGPHDEEVYVLHVAINYFDRNPAIKAIDRALYSRQVSMYQVILETGQARGGFDLSGPSLTIARNIVALEDSYNFHIVTGSPTIDREEAAQLIFSYGELATGRSLS